MVTKVKRWIGAGLILLVNTSLALAANESTADPLEVSNDFSTRMLAILQGPVLKVLAAAVLLVGVTGLLRGRHRLALAIGLAVITILILAISVSAGIRDNARVQSAANSIQSLRAAAENYLSNGNLNYSGMSISVLKEDNLLPAGFNAVKTNPWGGDFSIVPNAVDATRFDIVLTSLNQLQADKLTNYFNNSASASVYDSANTTWSVTF